MGPGLPLVSLIGCEWVSTCVHHKRQTLLAAPCNTIQQLNDVMMTLITTSRPVVIYMQA